MVVVNCPGAVLMPWIDDVAAVVVAWLPGEAFGPALASVLYGDVNPSGRLPVTFPISNNQTCVNTPQQYPGIDNEEYYTEGLLVGYRWYDANNEGPLFPFGHGLSYTSFVYHSLKIRARSIEFKIENAGDFDGYEVAQLYLGKFKRARVHTFAQRVLDDISTKFR